MRSYLMVMDEFNRQGCFAHARQAIESRQRDTAASIETLLERVELVIPSDESDGWLQRNGRVK